MFPGTSYAPHRILPLSRLFGRPTCGRQTWIDLDSVFRKAHLQIALLVSDRCHTVLFIPGNNSPMMLAFGNLVSCCHGFSIPVGTLPLVELSLILDPPLTSKQQQVANWRIREACRLRPTQIPASSLHYYLWTPYFQSQEGKKRQS
jgi:hypothetical protein